MVSGKDFGGSIVPAPGAIELKVHTGQDKHGHGGLGIACEDDNGLYSADQKMGFAGALQGISKSIKSPISGQSSVRISKEKPLKEGGSDEHMEGGAQDISNEQKTVAQKIQDDDEYPEIQRPETEGEDQDQAPGGQLDFHGS